MTENKFSPFRAIRRYVILTIQSIDCAAEPMRKKDSQRPFPAFRLPLRKLFGMPARGYRTRAILLTLEHYCEEQRMAGHMIL
jgi:hypothetical protein